MTLLWWFVCLSLDPWERYGESKLANILFTKELQRRCEREQLPIISVSLHPGNIVGTNLMRDVNLSAWWVMSTHMFTKYGAFGALTQSKSVAEGAATTVVAALANDIQPGEYYKDCNVSAEVHPRINDEALAAKLWTVSEEIVKTVN